MRSKIIALAFILHHCAYVVYSVRTVKVTECPSDENEWKNRGYKFNCSENQNKTYHCIKEKDGDLLELCMIRIRIPERKEGCPCVYRLKSGLVLFGAEYIACPDRETCPNNNHTGYFSNELFKFPGCTRSKRIVILKRNENETTTLSTLKLKPTSVLEKFKIASEVILFLLYGIVISLLIVKYGFWCKKKCKNIGTNEELNGNEMQAMTTDSSSNDVQLDDSTQSYYDDQLDDSTQSYYDDQLDDSTQSYYGITPFLLILAMIAGTLTMAEGTLIYFIDNINDKGLFSFCLKESFLILNLIVGLGVLYKEFRCHKGTDMSITAVSVLDSVALGLTHTVLFIVCLHRISGAFLVTGDCKRYPFVLMGISTIALVIFFSFQSFILLKSYKIEMSTKHNHRFHRYLILASVNGFLIIYMYNADARNVKEFDLQVFKCVVRNATIPYTVDRFFKTIFLTNLPYIQLFSTLDFLLCLSFLRRNIISIETSSANELGVKTKKIKVICIVILGWIFIVVYVFHTIFYHELFTDHTIKIVDETLMNLSGIVTLVVTTVMIKRSSIYPYLYVDFGKTSFWDYVILCSFAGTFIEYLIRIIGIVYWIILNFELNIGDALAELLVQSTALLFLFSQQYAYFLYRALILKSDRSFLDKVTIQSKFLIHMITFFLSSANYCLCVRNYYRDPTTPTHMTLPEGIKEALNSYLLRYIVTSYRLLITAVSLKMVRKLIRIMDETRHR